MSGEYRWESIKCAECGRGMRILVNRTIGIGAVPVSRELYELSKQGTLKDSFCCAKCERCYCYECSDMGKECKCGSTGVWKQTVYMEEKSWDGCRVSSVLSRSSTSIGSSAKQR